MREPDAYYSNGLILYGKSLSKNHYVAKGAMVDLSDLSIASANALNTVHQQLQQWLTVQTEDVAIQMQWMVDSDYRDMLDTYARHTEEFALNDWTYRVRSERYHRYHQAMKEGYLKRERLVIFFGKKINTLPKGGFVSNKHIDAWLAAEARSMEGLIAQAQSMLPFLRLAPMSDEQHHRHAQRFFNPSMGTAPIDAKKHQFDERDMEYSMLENAMPSDGVHKEFDSISSIILDNKCHAMIVLTRWAKTTYPNIIFHLTGCLWRDYCITLNIYPLNKDKEIEKEDNMISRLSWMSRKKPSLIGALQKRVTKQQKMTSGYVSPFKVLATVRVWANTQDELSSRITAVKTAVSSMNGARCHTANHPTQAKNLFFETYPANLGGKYRQWDMYAESDYLADLLPFSASFTGHHDDVQALYDTPSGGVMGVRLWAGGTPQHTTVIGKTGAGKSVNIIDLLSQTESHCGYTAIIDEGMNYGVYTKTLGCEPIVVHPDSGLCINYLDTHDLPMSQMHIANATALCMQMLGVSDDEDRNRYREAVIGKSLSRLYTNTYKDWRQANEAEAHENLKWAYASRAHKQKCFSDGTDVSFADAWRELSEWNKIGSPKEKEYVKELLSIPSEEELIDFEKGARKDGSVDYQSPMLVRDLAFTRFTRTMAPTHSFFVETLHYNRSDDISVEEGNKIATILESWSMDGSHGTLFDGVTNVSLTGRVTYFELGRIPESAPELKAACGFLIANYIRQHIIMLPRGMKKRFVIEEVARFLEMKGSEKIVKEAAAQLRKYSCWVCFIAQQYAQFRDTKIRPIIFGNTKLFLLLAQSDRPEVEQLAADIGLPDMAAETVHQFTLPENQREGRKYSPFLYYSLDNTGSNTGVARNYATDEMLYLASSDGEHFDKRSKFLRKYDNIVEGVIHGTTEESLMKGQKR